MGGDQSAATGRPGASEPGPHPQGLGPGTRYLVAGVGEGRQQLGTWRRQVQETGETLAEVTPTEAGRVGGKGLRQDLSRKNLAASDPSPFKLSHARPPQGRAFGN